MRAGLAFLVGVIGRAGMTALLIGARIADKIEMNLAVTLGSMHTRAPSGRRQPQPVEHPVGSGTKRP